MHCHSPTSFVSFCTCMPCVLWSYPKLKISVFTNHRCFFFFLHCKAHAIALYLLSGQTTELLTSGLRSLDKAFELVIGASWAGPTERRADNCGAIAASIKEVFFNCCAIFTAARVWRRTRASFLLMRPSSSRFGSCNP